MVAELELPFQRDIATIDAIAVVPTILDVVCEGVDNCLCGPSCSDDSQCLTCLLYTSPSPRD